MNRISLYKLIDSLSKSTVARNVASVLHGMSPATCQLSQRAPMSRFDRGVISAYIHTSDATYDGLRQLPCRRGELGGRKNQNSCKSIFSMLHNTTLQQRFLGTSVEDVHKDDENVEKGSWGKRMFRVEATYVGSMIRMYDLLNLEDFKNNFKAIHKGSALIALRPSSLDGRRSHIPATSSSLSVSPKESASSLASQRESDQVPFGPYMGVTTYGSAVFFDTPDELKNECLSLLQQVVVDPVVDTKYTEEFTLSVDPQLTAWSKLDPDCMAFQRMDLRNMHVISTVLSQSVALDYYSNHVERTLETFCSLNQEMMETANISKLNKQVLLQLVAENNIVMTEIISKLGVHERYDIAWKDAKYGHVWDFARTELEIETRFETLDMKLNLIQDNLKYFLEILQNRKSDFLEWIIIVLIAMEIGLSLYQLIPVEA